MKNDILSKVSYSFPGIYSSINQCSSLSFSWSFPADKLTFSSRGSCFKSWKIDFYFDYCILVFAMLQPVFIISSHPSSKSFPSIRPMNFQSPATPSYLLSQPTNTENKSVPSVILKELFDLPLSFISKALVTKKIFLPSLSLLLTLQPLCKSHCT